MLIEQVTVYGSFELLYLAISAVGDILPTVYAWYTNLSFQMRQVVLVAMLFSGKKLLTRIFELLNQFKTYLNDRL